MVVIPPSINKPCQPYRITVKRKIMETWTTCANALGQVLREWRISNGISLYSIAKYGATRVENVKKVEEGVANMLTLARYLDYIYTIDEEFFDNVLYIWQDRMKG